MTMGQSTISSYTQLAFIADRVVNALNSKQGYSENDKIVFRQAKKLLDDALSGQEVLNTGQLQARAVELLGAYGMALNAYAALAVSQKATQKEDIQKVISEFQSDMDELASGISKQGSKVDMIREFFRIVRDISLRSDVDSFDKVNIGTKFAYGVTQY